MGEQGKRSKEHWWNTFQKASFPAYVTLVDPPSLEEIDKDAVQVRVKALLMDDVLDNGGYKKGSAPQQFEVAEGSFVLVLPSDASSANAQFVSPPWLCRVNRIWFLPGGDAAGSSSYQDVKGTQPEVQQWEQRQIADGRVAAQHFQLQVTYFYRWPDLADTIEGSSNNTRRLAKALTSLGITQHEKDVEGLLKKRGCGRTPPNHFGMRYVVFSNHETKDPGPEPGSGDEGEETEDIPVPMESVMGTAEVLFLPSGSKLPYQQAPPPAAASAASAASDTARKAAQLPQALQTRLALKRRQLVPGFICNLFLAKAEGAEQQPKLFGLTEWADGSAGAALKDRPWVPNSRLQVRQLLADTQTHLIAAEPAAGGQRQPAGTSDAATATRATGSRAAAAAAAADEGDDGEHFVDAHSGSQHESGEQPGEQDAAGAGSSRKRRRQQQQQTLAGRGPAAGSSRGAAAAGKEQQQQQQQHKRRQVVGLESQDEEDEQQQQQQEARPRHRALAALLAAGQQEEEEEDDDEEDEDDSEDEGEDEEDDEEDEDEGQRVEAGELLSSGTAGEEEEAEEDAQAVGPDGAAAAAAAAAAEDPAAAGRNGRPRKKQMLRQGHVPVASAPAAAVAASEGDGSGSRQQRRHSTASGRQQQQSQRRHLVSASKDSGVRHGSSSGKRTQRSAKEAAAAAAAGTPHKRQK